MFLGIDVGTTAIKLGVIKDNKLLYEDTLTLETKIDIRGAHRQSAKDIEAVLFSGIKLIPKPLRSAIQAIGFSVAMHSLMPVDEGAMEDIFIWSDNQAKETIRAFRQLPEAERFYQITGTPIHPMSPFAKLLHFKNERKYSNINKWYGLKELMMLLFTGEVGIDYNTASTTGLFDIHELTWSEEILSYLSINKNNLASLFDVTKSFPILKSLAQELEVSPAVQIMIGGSDGCLSSYASYISTGNKSSLSIGTSAAVRKLSSAIALDSLKQNFCYYLHDDFFVIGAPSNNGGNVLEWGRQLLFEDIDHFFDNLPQILQQSSVGANGLRFHPYLNGERAPFWMVDKTATLKNMSIHHTKYDVIRALIEGGLMNIRVLSELVGIEDEITISGNFFKMAQLRQMLADILGKVCLFSETNAPIFGLYYLWNKNTQTRDLDCEVISVQHKVSQEYDTLYAHYFE